MGFKIDLKGTLGKVFFNETNLSGRVQKVDIVASAGELPYALLKVTIDTLNGVDIMPDNEKGELDLGKIRADQLEQVV